MLVQQPETQTQIPPKTKQNKKPPNHRCVREMVFRAHNGLFQSSDLFTHLSWIWPFHPLHGQAWSRSSGIPLLRHPLAVSSKRPHAWSSSLAHAHGRPTHIRVIHGGSHAGWIHTSRGASGARLVHELAVVGLSGAHLKR